MKLTRLAYSLSWLLLGCGQSDDVAREEVTLDFSMFDEAMNHALSDYNSFASPGMKLTGASAVVIHEKLGVVHSQGFGEFSADRLYLIASSSKMLSAGVLMRLADQGALDVDAPVGRYLSTWG